MFPSYCTSLGFAAWVLMLLIWAAVVAAVVWGVTRLFPSTRPRPDPTLVSPPTPPAEATTPDADRALADARNP